MASRPSRSTSCSRDSETIVLGGLITSRESETEGSVPFFGAIPLLGTIITGGQNEGVVAADFRITGPLDRPEVSVNPLSALAPGILRRILRAMDGAGGDGERPEGQAGGQ